MSESVFNKLHTTWPELEVFVSVVDRLDARVAAHRQMDMKLLSSPLLVGLTYVVYRKGCQPNEPCRSEWPKLSQALAAGGNVRYLHIQSQQDSTELYGIKIVSDSEPEEFPRLNLAGMHLPRLEELRIHVQGMGGDWGDRAYPWDAENCRLFRDAIDCSRLHTLDFGNDNPKIFFSYFNGILPALKSCALASTRRMMPLLKRLGLSVQLRHLSLLTSIERQGGSRSFGQSLRHTKIH